MKKHQQNRKMCADKPDKLISTIVTVHNAEMYIRECLDSLIDQTYRNIEILCIDGGSTDATPQILREYAAEDSRIRIIWDENTSYGHKINRGIEEARGEYISMLESDDYYDSVMLEVLYDVMEKEDVDFVNADYRSFFDVGGYRCSSVVHMYGADEYDRVIDHGMARGKALLISRYWTGLFKRSFLLRENIRMNESAGASFQDMSFRFLTSILAGRMYHVDRALYWYRTDNSGSSMHDCAKTVVIADEHDFLRKELQDRGITDAWVWHEALQWKYQDFYGNMAYLNQRGANRDRLFARYREELEKDRELIRKYRADGFRWMAEGMTVWGEEEAAIRIEEASQINAMERRELWNVLQRAVETRGGIVLFGCLGRGRTLLSYLASMCLPAFGLADNAEELSGKKLEGYEVWKPERAVRELPKAVYVITSKRYQGEMKAQLLAAGISEEQIIFWKCG